MPETDTTLLRQVILAFLAARRPAVYEASRIATRINALKLLDAPTNEGDVLRELTLLARSDLALVDMLPNPLDAGVVWGVTDAGIKRWYLDGRMAT